MCFPKEKQEPCLYVGTYVWSSLMVDWASTGMVANPACG